MIGSLREVDPPDVIESDLCIIGAGAAGIVLAREFIDTSLNVLVVESGGLDFEQATQDLYGGQLGEGLPYTLAGSRMRFFGGSTNCWTGFCAPLQESDMMSRPWVRLSGWPFGPDQIRPYYTRAQSLLDLGEYRYSTDQVEGEGGPLWHLAPGRLENKIWQRSSPSRFGQKFREELRAARNLRVLLHANALELLPGGGPGEVGGIRLASLEGKRTIARARRIVLATGGIENARLMLASRSAWDHGIGNDRDLVGRFFMEHPFCIGASVRPRGDPRWIERYAAFDLPSGGIATAGIGPTPAAQKELAILNAAVTFGLGRPDPDAGYMALSRIRKQLSAAEAPEAEDLWYVVRDLDDVGRGVCSRIRGERYSTPQVDSELLSVVLHLEQAPDPESRVTLSTERDALDQPRARLDWRLGEAEWRTARACVELVAGELGRLELGRTRIDDWLQSTSPDWSSVGGKFHHMGTTRMSGDPSRGVVDANGEVHGVSGLYLAGSSVFPTCGFANPTLTIVALALRLAAHLRAELLA